MKVFAQLATVAVLGSLAIGCSPAVQSTGSMSANNTYKIIGGSDVGPNDPIKKSIVGLYDTEARFICTGSLIDENIILTAAHCVGPKPEKMVAVFANDMDEVFKLKDRNELMKKIRLISKGKTAPNWGKVEDKDGQATDDIGLLRFEGSIPEGYQPADILTDYKLLTKGTSITVAGYGVSKTELVEVDKNAPDFEEGYKSGEYMCDNEDLKVAKCYKQVSSGSGKLRMTKLSLLGAYNQNELVLDQSHGSAVCFGDSGGPAYVEKDGKFLLWGVASRVSAGCNGYAIHTAALTHAKWLAETMTEFKKAN